MPRLSDLLPDAAEPGGPADDLDAWLDAENVPDGAPFLISPGPEYDIDLNRYFLRPAMIGAAQNTRLAAAGDLCRFLHESRGGKSWRDAQEDDHAAFLYWRRFDPAGPRVAASTWNRELALVNGFFAWAAGQQLITANPVPQRARRAAADRHRYGDGGELVPAAQARDTGRDKVQWLAPAEYRQWRDTGLRGYRADGLPDERFRGPWASRNALFADVMVRTGLRLAEQASLAVWEVPADDGGVAYQRFWLPEAVAKNRSARWVYLPAALARKVSEYCAADRAEIIAAARGRGTYDRVRDPLVIDHARGPASAVVVRRPDGGEAGRRSSGWSNSRLVSGHGCWSAQRTGSSRRGCGWPSMACRSASQAGRGSSATRAAAARRPGCRSPAIRTCSGIMRTAGLCALLWRFRWQGRRSSCCSPHNPPWAGVSGPASRAREGWLSAPLGALTVPAKNHLVHSVSEQG
jgi:site-specific recombinase XerD